METRGRGLSGMYLLETQSRLGLPVTASFLPKAPGGSRAPYPDMLAA